MRLELVRIPSGEDMLAGLRYLPEGTSRDVALAYAHGFTSGKYSMDSLAGYLAARGYEGLTFDFVGHKLGGSGRAMWRTEQAAENARDALITLRGHTTAEKVWLVGHSMGAAAMLQVAAWERQGKVGGGPAALAGVICLCMGEDPAREFASPIGQAMLAQRKDYVAGAPALTLLQGLATMVHAAEEIGDLPVLFIAARQDVLVSPARVEALAARVGPHAEVMVIESQHLDAPDRARIPIAQWLELSGVKEI